MSFTLATIQDRLERRLGDIRDVGDVIYDWATDLNQFLYEQLLMANADKYITTQSYSVSSSPSTQALPADKHTFLEMGCGFFIQKADGSASEQQLPRTNYGSTETGFYIEGSNVVFTGINTSETIILRYIPTIADIDETTDTFIVEDRYKALVVEGMVREYYKWSEDEREANSEQRFTRLLNEMFDTVSDAPLNFPIQLNSSVY